MFKLLKNLWPKPADKSAPDAHPRFLSDEYFASERARTDAAGVSLTRLRTLADACLCHAEVEAARNACRTGVDVRLHGEAMYAAMSVARIAYERERQKHNAAFPEYAMNFVGL